MKLLMIILMALGLSSTVLAKGDAAKGKAKSATCMACHGLKGISAQAIYPNLAGQKEAYMVKQLKDFKSGKRKDPLMSAMAKPLSDADMANVSAYYAKMK
ncbi:MAG: cytochrome c [Bdellovibrionaceae bacterium]|nr:cytochrome c [Pseudobdellovibrionaceae bacterium]